MFETKTADEQNMNSISRRLFNGFSLFSLPVIRYFCNIPIN